MESQNEIVERQTVLHQQRLEDIFDGNVGFGFDANVLRTGKLHSEVNPSFQIDLTPSVVLDCLSGVDGLVIGIDHFQTLHFQVVIIAQGGNCGADGLSAGTVDDHVTSVGQINPTVLRL